MRNLKDNWHAALAILALTFSILAFSWKQFDDQDKRIFDKLFQIEQRLSRIEAFFEKEWRNYGHR